MEKEKLIFRMAARCEAAGRPNNEDNYQVSDNLTDNHWGFTADKEISLGDKGSLLVVCDGMGGMNAGEVASAIAVATIKEWFDKDKLTDAILESSESIQRYLVDAIQAADAAIKADGKENIEHDGMGSTIVMAWLLGQKVYVGWCGDSRAYRYNPKSGLMRLSHDHSYVQELVDAGKLTEELAFDHPNNNIITRSLGDPRGKAQPDTKEYDLCDEDIILLCSDGLCGCLRDNEIEDVVKQHQTSMQECRDALWEADEAAGWHDNVTIVLAQVISGGTVVTDATAPAAISDSKAELMRKNRLLKRIVGGLLAVILIVAAVICCHHFGLLKFTDQQDVDEPTPVEQVVEEAGDLQQGEQPAEQIEASPAPEEKQSEKKAPNKPKKEEKPQVNEEKAETVPDVETVPAVQTVETAPSPKEDNAVEDQSEATKREPAEGKTEIEGGR